MDVPYVPEGVPDAAIVIQGAPFDAAVTQRPGTRFGPDAIRLASRWLQWEPRRWPWTWSPLEQVADTGDVWNFEVPFPGLAEMATALQARTSVLLDAGKRVLTFGGDHYVSLPLLRAHAARHGPLGMIHFDAHSDHDDSPTDHHGVMFRRAIAEGVIDPARVIQVGLRTWYAETGYPFTVLDADAAIAAGAGGILARIREVVGGRPAYLTFDIDCLDPAHAPGTGTPVVGGLSSNLALQAVRGLAGLPIVGADLVEVSPPYDPAGITALAGATVALEMLHVLASSMHDAIDNDAGAKS